MGGEQLQQHGLADEVERCDVGTGAERQQIDGEARFGNVGMLWADVLRDLCFFCQQHIQPQGGVQAQHAGVLIGAERAEFGQQAVKQFAGRVLQRSLDAGKVGHPRSLNSL